MLPCFSLCDQPREILNLIGVRCDRKTLASLSLTCRNFSQTIPCFASLPVVLEAIQRAGAYRTISPVYPFKKDIRVLNELLFIHPKEWKDIPLPEQIDLRVLKRAFVGAKLHKIDRLCSRLLLQERGDGPLHRLDQVEQGFFKELLPAPCEIFVHELPKALADDEVVIEAALRKNGSVAAWMSPRLQNDRPMVMLAMKTWYYTYDYIRDPGLRADTELVALYMAGIKRERE